MFSAIQKLHRQSSRVTFVATCATAPSSSAGFSTSALCLANRALVYRSNGNPSEVLSSITYPNLPPPPPQCINIRHILSPVNPADINVIEGVYPLQPIPTKDLGVTVDSGTQYKLENEVHVVGNEGLAEVTEVGSEVTRFKKGDRVVMLKQQTGTWRTSQRLKEYHVLKVPDEMSDVVAATVCVNFLTAYNMLRSFTKLAEGDWVMQNGANSAVGQAVIQIAARKGWRTINFVRNRENIEELRNYLTDLGATHVLTYDDLADKSLKSKVKEWTANNTHRLNLMLNCVGGEPTARMAKLLQKKAHLVTYGAMSKQPLSVPTSLFIFNNLTAHGFWQSRWINYHRNQQAGQFIPNRLQELADMKLKEPEHEILTLSAALTDDEVTQKVREVIGKIQAGKYGKKVLLKFEEPSE